MITRRQIKNLIDATIERRELAEKNNNFWRLTKVDLNIIFIQELRTLRRKLIAL